MNRFPMKTTLLAGLVLFAGLLSTATAQDSAKEAKRIFEEVERRQKLVQDEKASVEMTITNSKGQTRKRAMTLYTKVDGGKTKSLVVFTAPADIRGMGLLTLEGDEADDQKLYLPALGRVQRISGSKRGERFAGSRTLRSRTSAVGTPTSTPPPSRKRPATPS